MQHLTLQVLQRGRWVDVGNRRGRSSAVGAALLRQRRHPHQPVRVVDRDAAVVVWPSEEPLPPPPSDVSPAGSGGAAEERLAPRRRRSAWPHGRPPP